MLRTALILAISNLVGACALQDETSVFADESSSAVAPPLEQGLALAGETSKGVTGARAPLEAPKPKTATAKEPELITPFSEVVDEPAPKVTPKTAPEVDANGKKWFTGARDHYYLPLKNDSKTMQLFDAKTNQPKDWYYNDNDKMLAQNVQFGDGGKLIYPDEAFKMSKVQGGWKGEGQKRDGEQFTKNGLEYYYGKFEGDSAAPNGWSYRYSITDPNAFQTSFPQAPVGNLVKSAPAGQPIWLRRDPRNGGSELHMLPNGYDPIQYLQPLTAAVQPRGNGQGSWTPQDGSGQLQPQIQQPQQKPSGRAGQIILVSGIGCSHCQAPKQIFIDKKLPYVEIPMGENKYGVTSFPGYVRDNGDGTYSPAEPPVL